MADSELISTVATRSRQEQACRLIFAVLALSAAVLVVLLAHRAHQSLNGVGIEEKWELGDP
jgi:hypothetical protein